MLTDRGRAVLALGGVTYLAAWGFGARVLYPVALGLVLAVGVASLWVRLLNKPMSLRRAAGRGEHVAGDDVPVRLDLDVEGNFPVGSVVVTERIARLGERETVMKRREGKLSGWYVLRSVPRGRYAIESANVVIEDPFGLERVDIPFTRTESLLVYPRLTELDRVFSDSGARQPGGRQLLLRRPTGYELHGVRDYEQGESLRRVHWPSTARRGQLMVKELEDTPRDKTAVLLDADASTVVGEAPESTFEVQVRAAGSILKAHARRGRRASLIVNSATRAYQRVHSYDGDWHLALELLAAAEPDGQTAVATLLADEAGPASRALELTVVTAGLSAKLVDRLLQRTLAHHTAAVVYVDPASFAGLPARPLRPEESGLLLRLQRAGVPVAVVRRGDDLVEKLDAQKAPGVAVG